MQTGYAHVPTVPGEVTETTTDLKIVAADKTGEWHHFAGPVTAGWQFDGHTFLPPKAKPQPIVPPTLDEAKAAKLNELKQSCTVAIYNGFASQALGAAHNYPSGLTDQVNLQTAAIVSLAKPEGFTALLWCDNGTGNWSMTPHSGSQIQQVIEDFMTFVTSARNKLINLTAGVNDATTVDQVVALQW